MTRLIIAIAIWFILFKHSHQGCTSTKRVTTCTWDTLELQKPLIINDYRNYLEISGGYFKEIPSGTFKFLPLILDLQLRNNNIKFLEEDTFLGIEHLRMLLLTNNSLTEIKNHYFKHCTYLQELDLSMNNISVIHDKAFQELVNLEYLFLSHNFLKVVPAINVLPKIRTLKLNNNKIQTLRSNDFSNLGKLVELDLSLNQIAKIEEHAFNGIYSLELDLTSNDLTDLNARDIFVGTHAKKIKLSVNEINITTLCKIVDGFNRYYVDVVVSVSKKVPTNNGCKQ